ncbi:MAG: hypothetical protein GY801_09005 [bacterium]|nr:hypothetical protein [bacterium]
MSKRKRQAKKKLRDKQRLQDAKRWLFHHPQNDLISAYSKRYGVDPQVAEDELMQLGYYEHLCIQRYEQAGVAWEYRVEPLSGEMLVVPQDIEEHEMYEIHGIIR